MFREAEVFTLSGESVHFDRNMHLKAISVSTPHFSSANLRKPQKYNDGALDAFYLGCPLRGENNCSYVMKLKSPAQLAAFLQKTEQRGIL